MRERVFQQQVIAYATLRGWKVAHFDASVRVVGKERRFVGDRGSAGFPDIVAVRAGRLIFAELKSEKGKISEKQADWLDELQVVDGAVSVYLWLPSDWDEIERIFK